MSDMRNLYEHLKSTRNRWAYIKLLLWRHRSFIGRLLGYVILTLAIAYSVSQAFSYSDKIGQQAVVQNNSLTISLAEGSFRGCENINATIIDPLRRSTVDGLATSKVSIANLVKEGTFTEAQGKRIIKTAEQSTKRNLSRIQYRNCANAAERYIKQVTDVVKRAELRGTYAEAEMAQQRERIENGAP